MWTEIEPDVFALRDTCNVYVLRSGREATAVDFGSGSILDRLGELGVERLTDVVLTHHHRDQLQGLGRAAAAGARIWAPPVEVDLVAEVDRHWLGRPLDVDYDLREDRFSLLEPVRVDGVVEEYRARRYGAAELYALPTPGHTVGSVTYLAQRGDRLLAFTGDLLYGGGKLWSLAATQWSYSGTEGQVATSISCAILADRRPDVLLPSHGDPIRDPQPALERTRALLRELIDLRREDRWDFDAWFRDPWQELSPHLLRSRTTIATSYALVSESGHVLLFDWGYDLWTGFPAGADRAARRPLLTTLEDLDVEVAIPTHYHDDHVAGLNLLRDVRGTQIWIPENVAPILADPHRRDLPCLWFDPIPADRTLPLGRPFRWREYELTVHPLPGHTRYAAAIEFAVDGRRVLVTGDQQTGPPVVHPNYQYRNRFSIDDYVHGAELYASLRPDLILGGHWPPLDVDHSVLAQLRDDGRRVADLHRALLPLDDVDFGAEGFAARIEPYRSSVAAGTPFELEVEVAAGPAVVRLAAPTGWTVEPEHAELDAPGRAGFRVTAAGPPACRVRVAADVTVAGVRYGQQAEALVDVT
ncbi:MAG TPA: MBL fold metallo-hydrolase [Gaiellaceae bacterium]|nr:MBL fold metallo-hydrolase [Gaiellaceae bacterium]